MFLFVIFSFVITGNINKWKENFLRMKKIFFFMLEHLHSFYFFSRTQCPTEVVSSQSNSYYCWSVCSYHVMYAFQSESTLYICLNVKELLAQNRRNISSLSDSDGTWTHNHLVHKWTLNHVAKLESLKLESLKQSQ